MEHESEGRILAQIERGLSTEDPGLAARMSTLNDQFPGKDQDGAPTPPAPPKRHRHRHRRTALILVVIALVGMLLTAVLNASSNEAPAPPSSLTPTVSR